MLYLLYWGDVEMNGGWIRAIASRPEKRESQMGLYGWVFRIAKTGPQSGKMKCGVVPITANGEQGLGKTVKVVYVRLEELE